DDGCWAKAEWHAIDQVWIPWGGSVAGDDYNGHYKVTWSSETDRFYFLVEITDDVLVDGYRYPQDAYHNWDIVEIFFDEDASGGDHTLNENAFAYHITAGNSDSEFEAMDLGPDWKKMNYSDHLEVVIEKQDGNTWIWEIAMKVYDDSYNTRRKDNKTAELEAGMRCGLSIAYCDNDDPDEEPKSRDNFFGSVPVPEANFNDHWQNADWFGQIVLTISAVLPESAD
ncbi:MAG: hypothetical protein JW874_07925, partial [Spirochaetales bacterium]|nr:hypothetical protein [Spirochaetales bacterium]